MHGRVDQLAHVPDRHPGGRPHWPHILAERQGPLAADIRQESEGTL